MTQTYLEATATKMMAASCIYCGAKLIDAASVEAGMGPECRKKFGANPPTKPQSYADIEKYLVKYLTDGDSIVRLVALTPTENPRKIANTITNFISKHVGYRQETVPAHNGLGPYKRNMWYPTHVDVAHLIILIRMLGYHNLANTLAKRLYRVVVIRDVNFLLVKAPFNQAFGAQMKLMRATWRGKEWILPVQYDRQLIAILRNHFAGELLFGLKGQLTL